jgi:hypothetical protein
MEASDRIKQPRLTAGRQVVAVRRLHKSAAAHNMPEVEARCALAEDSAMTLRAGEQRWATERVRLVGRVDAKALDKQIDGAFHAIDDACSTHERAAASGIQTAQSDAAALIREHCIKAGAYAITRQSYEDQFASMQGLADQYADPQIMAAANTLGVSSYFDVIINNRDAYELAIQQTGPAITGRQLAALRRQAHAELCELIALVLAQTPGDAEAPLRAELIGHIDAQTDALRRQRAANAPTTDLNPATGEEEEPTILSPAEELD